MKRAIVTPAVLPPSALAELKQWLGITTAQDDALLSGLLQASLELCEAFTGIIPIEAECEEVIAIASGWCALATKPVQAITGIEGITKTGDRFTLSAGAYEFELDADGTGLVRIISPAGAANAAIRFAAGLAPDWDSLPEPLRHGMMRLAAHQHRERETSGAAPLPPAAVAALWRPWRRMRLA